MKIRIQTAPGLRGALIAAVLIAALLIVAILIAAPVRAQDLHKDDGSFNFFNDSGDTVTEFRIGEASGKFGQNWLAVPMAPGHGLTMTFPDPLDTCADVLTRVVFYSGAVFDRAVNYCGTAIVRVTDDRLHFE
ncbi:MAG: hypothetical protein ACK4LQ_08440 [Pararhodobacter sp.]